MTLFHCLVVVACLGLYCNLVSGAEQASGRWSEQKANDWYANQPWLVGCNFIPSTAVNQLEMWQPETFDLDTIDKELSLAKGLGFNSIRIFLHDLLWEQDAKGLLDRVDQFLAVADKHGIGVMIVFFDGVWNPHAKLGKQPVPIPHLHNSGWVQSPTRDLLKDPERHDSLKPYVTGVIERFKDDRRVQVWDIYNEPDNVNAVTYGASSKTKTELPNKPELALALIEKAFTWAREANPSQPVTSGIWSGDWKTIEAMTPMARFCAQHSDVISFHSYARLDDVKSRVGELRQFNRPLLCTEYMARTTGSTFETILPYFKEHKIGAYNWGFVNGKSQTIYPWDSWQKQYTDEPKVWFHDIFHKDGAPYREDEVELIRKLTGVK